MTRSPVRDHAELAGLTLARQFAPVESVQGSDAVAGLLTRIGPIQSQTARASFLGLAARAPGVDFETITTAFEDARAVRGSTIRGTVHSCAADDHVLLDLATRIGQRQRWERALPGVTPEQAWALLEEFATDDWRTPAELNEHLWTSLARTDSPAGSPAENQETDNHPVDEQLRRYLAISHSGLIRRPLNGPWSGQGAPGYRAADAVLTELRETRAEVLTDPGSGVQSLIRRHLSAHGPACRQDLAWWSGLALSVIDAGLRRLELELVEVAELDGRTYLDLPDAPAATELQGVRLLPEFDCLLCGYDPTSRGRFVDAEHYPLLWNRGNGLMKPPLLINGRIAGWWRLDGPSRRRQLEVHPFPGRRAPFRDQLTGPVSALEAALAVSVTSVEVR